MKRTTIYADETVITNAKLYRLNISAVCEEAIKNEVEKCKRARQRKNVAAKR